MLQVESSDSSCESDIVDVLLATYNGAAFLAEQLDSLIAQNYKRFRVLMHDDGSTDETISILKRYCARYPEKFILIDDGVHTGGAKNNFSHLVSKSQARYVMFCDQDDVWLPWKIEKSLDKMYEIEAVYPELPVIVHTDVSVVDSNLTLVSGSIFSYQKMTEKLTLDELLVQNNVTGCTVVANRQAIDLAFPLPQEAIMHDWWLALMVEKQKGVVWLMAESSMLYRQHDRNAVGSKNVGWLYLVRKLLEPRRIISDNLAMMRQANKVIPNSSKRLFIKKIWLTLKRYVAL